MSVAPEFSVEPNRLIAERGELFAFVTRQDIGELLEGLDYNWASGQLDPSSEAFQILQANGFTESSASGLRLNRMGLLLLGRLLIHFGSTGKPNDNFGGLKEKFDRFEVLSSGKNAIVAKARHRLMKTEFVLKIVRPGASENLVEAIQKLGELPSSVNIIRPVDIIQFQATDLLGKLVSLDCIVFPVAEGITFRKFLDQENRHLNSQVVSVFAKQVGQALGALEQIGAYHGDLHEENIMVDQYAHGGLSFKLIDVSFDAMGSLPYEYCSNNDLERFKQHIWRILSVQRRAVPGVSLRKYIGTKNYIKIRKVLSEATQNFADVRLALDTEDTFREYINKKAEFVQERFERPVSFRLQRYEEITEQAVAVKLFVPFEPLMDKIKDFSNVYLSGSRGSGKSTYLASLAFLPTSDDDIVDFKRVFGVYFPCRQGEFRAIATKDKWSSDCDNVFTTHIVVLKIIRRTLETILSGISHGRIAHPTSLDGLRKFIDGFVPAPGIVLVDQGIQTEIENYVSTMVRVEMDEVKRLSKLKKPTGNEKPAAILLEFFDLVRKTFDALATTQFHLLFDDAGAPYMPLNVQRVINDLIITSNSLFCVKFSAEKLTFRFENSDLKVLENGQDYFEHDISQMLFIGSGSGGLDRTVLEEYFREIVEQRLRHFGYQSHQIVDYLDDQPIPYEKFVSLLASKRKDAYYCGWTTVWNIADRTPRNLLELVSEIFSVANIDASSKPTVVTRRNQDRAIRSVSEKRLESLSQIPGAVVIGGKAVSLGRTLFETTAALGSTFRKYLRAEIGNQRKRQHLAIERNEMGELDPEADAILNKLITFGILDSGKLAYARDDEVKKPVYVLNRIYCPAFGIGYRRDVHLRLSKGKLEMLLVDPSDFMKFGTRRLREYAADNPPGLFDYRES